MSNRRQSLLFLCCLIISTLTSAARSSAESLDRKHLPIARSFTGKIGPTYRDSQQDFPTPITAPKGAPSFMIVLLDDVGFGQPSVNGGLIPTPYLERLAKEGLFYNRFHTTGICSPTRASLMAGRNHHQLGFGTITEMSTGFPGYDSTIRDSTTLIPKVLKYNGYNTSLFGKWHNTPDWVGNAAGPFDQWPIGLGFEHFYGFLGGETSQYHPQLYLNTSPIEPAKTVEQGYHLTEDLVDQAIAWIDNQHSIAPDKPYFMFFCPGAVHSPIHAPKQWIDKFKGQYDFGWDVYRELAFKKQKQMGLIPAHADLTPRPKEIPAWESQSKMAKTVYARQAEAVAGYLAHTDHHIGRLLDHARSLPDGDELVVFYITGDNGASPEGTMAGTDNNMLTQNGLTVNLEDQYKVLDELGGPEHEYHYGVPWSWAYTTPFQ